MRWSRILLSGGAVLGAAATYNAAARRGAAPLTNRIGGDAEWFAWRGHRIAFTRRGQGSPVLLVHGVHAAASSFEWRSNVAALAERHTVYTLDLLGFGLSDRPPIRYSSRLYTALVDDFVDRVVRGPVALVASSLSAAYAIVLGSRDAARYPALVIVQPTGLVRFSAGPDVGTDLARIAVDTPVIGTAMFNAIVSRAGVRRWLERAYADDRLVTEDLVDVHYDTAHRAGARHAPAAFMAGRLNVDVRHALRRLTQPTLLVWGERAKIAPVDEARGFLALKPDLELAILDPAGDLPHDERPAEFNETVLAFLDRALRTSVPPTESRSAIAARSAGAA